MKSWRGDIPPVHLRAAALHQTSLVLADSLNSVLSPKSNLARSASSTCGQLVFLIRKGNRNRLRKQRVDVRHFQIDSIDHQPLLGQNLDSAASACWSRPRAARLSVGNVRLSDRSSCVLSRG